MSHVNHLVAGQEDEEKTTTLCGIESERGEPVEGDPYCFVCVRAAVNEHNEVVSDHKKLASNYTLLVSAMATITDAVNYAYQSLWHKTEDKKPLESENE